MELSQYGELFLSESREHVSAINHLLLTLESNPGSREAVEGVFRAVHTIKGMSATMGYRTVADLAHELENLLEQVRTGKVAADGNLIDLLFAAADALERSIEVAVEDGDDDADVRDVLTRLRVATGASATESAAVRSVVAPPEDEDSGAGDAAAGMTVRLVISKDSPLLGVRAFLALRRAREMGEVSAVDPAEASLQEEGFAGTLRFVLRTDHAPGEVHEALASVGDIESVSIVERVPVVLPEEPGVEDATESRPGDDRTGAASRVRNIRVDLRRLDALMNQVGELVIVRDRLRQLAAGATPELGESVDQAARLIGELQDEIMRARMAPVWQVFDRFPRLVRDAARLLGKQVDFVIEGKEIELDRSMLDEIGDPLVHLLRNSLDHGIESPAERRAAGKLETGTLQLTASRERSRVMIRVEDDGRGIQRQVVLAKAVSRGIVSAEAAAAMTDEEVYGLLTHAGFSTAEKITDVSGRGVGLDVVATRVRALGGLLEIYSDPGKATVFTLQLPLTLAIVRALLVRLGDETYALPLTHVGETVHLASDQVRAVKGKTVALLRDEVIPLLSLHTILRRSGSNGPGAKRAAVILEVGEQRVGIEVDGLLGQQEIVVKAFDATSGTMRVFSGATILSDGRPALILDAGSILAGADAR